MILIFIQITRYHLLFLFKYRALEEKWKQKEEKEKRFRERVLQQRKLKHQEATEKFQRTHLPFPQHEKIGLEILSMV